MSNVKKHSLPALIIATLSVLAAVCYIFYADKIAGFFHSHIGTPDYSGVAEVCGSPLDGGIIQVHVIDVGQGDSTLIRSSNGTVLIDAGTGASEAALKAHLDACGVRKIDYLICTHPHDDHIGGADMVLNEFSVGTVIMTELEATTYAFESLLDAIEEREVNAEIPALGEEYTLGDMHFRILGPVSYTDDANNMSLIVRLTYGETVFMFTGDAESPSEKELVETYTAADLDCDFYNVGHHGANTSSSAEFLELLTPEIAAVSCGKDNEYGHPRGETLKRLEDAGVEKILRTDEMGTVVVISDGKVLTVAAE